MSREMGDMLRRDLDALKPFIPPPKKSVQQGHAIKTVDSTDSLNGSQRREATAQGGDGEAKQLTSTPVMRNLPPAPRSGSATPTTTTPGAGAAPAYVDPSPRPTLYNNSHNMGSLAVITTQSTVLSQTKSSEQRRTVSPKQSRALSPKVRSALSSRGYDVGDAPSARAAPVGFSSRAQPLSSRQSARSTSESIGNRIPSTANRIPSSASRTPSATRRTVGTPGVSPKPKRAVASGGALETSQLRSDLSEAMRQIELLRLHASEDAELVTSLTDQRDELEASSIRTAAELRARDEEIEKKTRQLALQSDEIIALKAQLAAKDMDLASAQTKSQTLQQELSSAEVNTQQRIDAITEAANSRMFQCEEYIISLQQKVEDMEKELAAAEGRLVAMGAEKDANIRNMSRAMKDGELVRMQLHTSIQEMKGNIRVLCRVRPFIAADREFFRQLTAPTCIDFPDTVDHRSLTLKLPAGGSQEGKEFLFSFDKVFDGESSQKDVFGAVQNLVQSALEGYKVCVFAYGQTGSGKTYTMEGPNVEEGAHSDPANQGIIPRAVTQVFEHSQAMTKKGWSFQLSCSFVEIYNETIHDLLNSVEVYSTGFGSGEGKVKHEVRVVDGFTTITGIAEIPVEDAGTVHELLKISARNRKSATTGMNERASRSHSIFTLKIIGHNEGTSQETLGVLNLIDLAGSERLAQSMVQGGRLKETQHINRSLTCLGDVIVALARGDSHIPFRNSKLTHVLQPYMGDESKTLMFVNLSPSESYVNESLCSLRFAAKVNACEIGLARKRISSVSADKAAKKPAENRKRI